MFCWNRGDACVVLSLMSTDEPQNAALGQQFVNKWNNGGPVCAHAHTAFILWAKYSKWSVFEDSDSHIHPITIWQRLCWVLKQEQRIFTSLWTTFTHTHFFECADMFTRLCHAVWPTSERHWRQVAVQLADPCLLGPELVTFLQLQMLRAAVWYHGNGIWVFKNFHVKVRSECFHHSALY